VRIIAFLKQTYYFSTSSPARLVATIAWLIYSFPGIWLGICKIEEISNSIMRSIGGIGGFYHPLFFWQNTKLLPKPYHVWLPFMGDLGIYNIETPNKAIYLLAVLVVIWIGSILIYSGKVKR